MRDLIRKLDAWALDEDFLATETFFGYDLLEGDHDPMLLATALRVSFSYREKIPSWHRVYKRAHDTLIARGEDPTDYLQGLE